MKRVIFVEGETEAIFVRQVLDATFPGNVSCDIVRLSGNGGAPHSLSRPNASKEYELLIVGNDSRVLTAIKDRCGNYEHKNYDRIIGLRDMYCSNYKKYAHVIDDSLIEKFRASALEEVKNFDSPVEIGFHFAVMEIETWMLGMPGLFRSIDAKLTPSFINKKIGINLEDSFLRLEEDNRFFHPANVIGDIFALSKRKKYSKSLSDVEALISSLDAEQIMQLMESEKAPSFNNFYESLV